MTLRHSLSGCTASGARVNEALRHGLREMAAPAKPRKPFRIQPIDVGDMLIPDIDNVAEVLAMLEDNPCEPR
jgi:hypothetical protein